MSKSPGHQRMPDHKVEERHPAKHFRVKVGDEILAESDDVIEVVEDGAPNRYYFPRADVRMDRLSRTETVTQCPSKGTAHYFSLKMKDKMLGDAVWTYEEPFDEHIDLKDRLAFWDDNIKDLTIEAQAA